MNSNTPGGIAHLSLDDLLLKASQVKALNPPTQSSHRDVYHWILWNKPVDGGQYDWIYQVEDFASLAAPRRLDEFIESSIQYMPKIFRVGDHCLHCPYPIEEIY